MQITLVGLGNIGSFAAGAVARLENVTRLTLVDGDLYEARNLGSQAVGMGDVGRGKAAAQERRLRGARPGLEVVAVRARVEDLPVGRLDCDLLLAAVDSRETRLYLNRVCRALGVAWIDSGVEAGTGLARVTRVGTAEGDACLECAWSARMYETLGTAYACQGATPRTGATAALGAAAGGLLAAECENVLRARRERSDWEGREMVFDTRHLRTVVSGLRRNAECRCSHERLALGSGRVRLSTALGDVLAAGGAGSALRVAFGGAFARGAYCAGCGRQWRVCRLERRLTCGRCRGAFRAAGMELREELAADDCTAADMRRGLRSLGVRVGDVLVVRGAGGEIRMDVEGEDDAGFDF